MDGEVDGAQAQGAQQSGQPVDQAVGGQQPQGQQQQQRQAPQQVTADDGAADASGVGNGSAEPADEEEYRAALADRDKMIAELEAQVAEAAKSVESANALTRQIEELKASADAERTGFELKLAGARNVTAAKALLAEHGGDVGRLKAAEPWLFADAGNGASGLEPAGAAVAGDADMKRWRAIAGLED